MCVCVFWIDGSKQHTQSNLSLKWRRRRRRKRNVLQKVLNLNFKNSKIHKKKSRITIYSLVI